MRIAFRVDASAAIGSGHVTRCVTLASALGRAGAETLFICRDHPGHLNDYLVEQGFPVARLSGGARTRDPDLSTPQCPPRADRDDVPWSEDAKQTIHAIKEWGEADWLVVDHYALEARWEAMLHPTVRSIMVIDDLADRPHDCDLLLDHNCTDATITRYDALVPSACRKLLGPEYALLRPEFAEARERPRERTGEVRRVLVSFGGSDPANATRMAIDALLSRDRGGVKADVVVGAANPRRQEIEKICAEYPPLQFHCQPGNIAALMAGSDLAIGGGGVALLERCALGLPSIVVAIAENQLAASRAVAARGGALFMGSAPEVPVARLAAAIDVLSAAPELVRHMGAMAEKIVDGRGCGRVVANLLASAMALRRATLDDCDSVWRWRNDSTVRQYSNDPGVIELSEHRRWYAAALQNRSRVLLIGENAEGAVGVLRYDVTGHSATISVYLVPGRQGRGLGPELIRLGEAWLRDHRPEVREIRAEIDARNAASVRAFAKAGFVADRAVFVREIPGG